MVNDQIRGVLFACLCFAALCLVLAGIAYHNTRVPWPEMDNRVEQSAANREEDSQR